MTVSKAADRSSRIRTDDLESAFAIHRASVTDSSAVSVEWPLLKSDSQGLEGAAYAGLEERGHRSSRQEVKVEHRGVRY